MPINIGGSRPDVKAIDRSEDRGECGSILDEHVYKAEGVLALPEEACGAAGQKMMRCGSRIIRDKVSRKGRGKDRRRIIK